MNEIILATVISLTATAIMSRVIDSLYQKFFDELTFPNEIKLRGKFRKPILAAAIFFCAIISLQLPTPQNFYSTTGIIFLLTVCVTDFEQQIVFDEILIVFSIIGIFSTLHQNFSLTNHLIAAISGGGFFLLLALVTKSGIGGGDIKLIASLGLWFGTEKLFSIVTIGMIFGGIAALILLIAGKKNRGDFFAYAPYFALTSIYFLFNGI